MIQLSDVTVVAYRWQHNGTVTVELSWAPGKRRSFSVMADQFHAGTVLHLREQTVRDVNEKRLA